MKPNRIPKRSAAVVERVNERDRAFCRAHPGERAYLRPYVPGEYPPDALAAFGADAPELGSWLLVHNLAAGLRCRQPVGRLVAGGPVVGWDCDR